MAAAKRAACPDRNWPLDSVGRASNAARWPGPQEAMTRFQVEGMTCHKCVGRVTKILLAVEGVVEAHVDLEGGIAEANGGGSVVAIIAALAEGGYPARQIVEEPVVKRTLQVDDMTCKKCIGRVEKILMAIPGVSAASVNLEAGTADVEGNATVNVMTAALEEGGYPARELNLIDFDEPSSVRIIKVEGMTCRKCVGRVEKALMEVGGVTAARVNLEAGTAEVEGTALMSAMIARLQEGGYPATEFTPGAANLVDIDLSPASAPPPPARVRTLQVEGMTCKKCVGRVEKALMAVSGVTSARVDLAAGTAEVEGTAEMAAMIAQLHEGGYPARELTAGMVEALVSGVRKLQVEGMTCNKCVGRVEKALMAVPGVTSARVDLAAGTAEVEGTAELLAMVRALEEGGYPAREAGRGSARTLQVEGMTCHKCVGRVEKALMAVPGVVAARVDLAAGTAEVEGTGELAAMIAALEEGGYPAREAGSSEGACGPAACALKGAGGKEAGREERGTFKLEGMTASCAAAIEKQLLKVNGVREVEVDKMSRRVQVVWDAGALEEALIMAELRGLGLEPQRVEDASVAKVTLQVAGMTCAACVGRIERGLGGSKGIVRVTVSLGAGTATVELRKQETGVREVLARLEKIGYEARVQEGSVMSGEQATVAQRQAAEAAKWRALLLQALCFTVPAFLVAMVLPHVQALRGVLLAEVAQGVSVQAAVLFVLCFPVQFCIGARFYLAALNSLRHGSASMDVLVSLGTLAAFCYSVLSIAVAFSAPPPGPDDPPPTPPSHFFETSAMLVTFVLLGRTLEAAAKGEASDAVQKLVRCNPSKAVLCSEQEGGGWHEEEVETKMLQVGDVVKVVTGANIPCDGEVLPGSTGEVDEALVTGESVPCAKAAGEKVVGGSLVVDGVLYLRASRVGEDTFLAQVVRMVAEAQGSKAPMQLLADRIAGVFVPIIVCLAMLTFFVWYACCQLELVPHEWMLHDNPVLFAFLFANAVLVVACPCALGLATPTAVMVGTGVGARLGVLIKSGAALEKMRSVTAVVLDKTGTVTEGRMQVAHYRVAPHPTHSSAQAEGELWALLGCAERGSGHPIAKALVAYADKVQQARPAAAATDLHSEAGKGLRCVIEGREVMVGKRGWVLGALGGGQESAAAAMQPLEGQGHTTVYVAAQGRLVGAVALADKVRAEAKEVIAALQESGVRVAMLTGDNASTAHAVAAQVGIGEADVRAEVLPNEKGEVVKALQEEGYVVAMVGDGLNDSVALAQADAGVALGAGADVAIEAADVVLVHNDLRLVYTAMDLSRTTFRRIVYNYFWAMAYNITAVPMAAGVFYPFTRTSIHPAVAGLAMAMSSVSVVISSLLLKRYKPPPLNGAGWTVTPRGEAHGGSWWRRWRMARQGRELLQMREMEDMEAGRNALLGAHLLRAPADTASLLGRH